MSPRHSPCAMILCLPSGISLFLVASALLRHSQAAHEATDACSRSALVDETVNTGASFVQRHARALRDTARTSDQRTVVKQYDAASTFSNRTAHGLPGNLMQQKSAYEHHASSLLANGLFRPVPYEDPAKLNAVAEQDVDGPVSILEDIEPRWLISATVFACALLSVYFCSGTSQRASDAYSNPLANRPNNPENNAPEVQAASPNSYRTARDVVEDLGFGWAQIQLLLLADGIWFLDGWELALMGTVATSTASDLGLGAYGRAKLASTLALGFIPGNILGGWVGDRYGRKPPLVASYILVAVVAWATAWAPDATTVYVLRFCMGVGISIGMPCSTVLISELTPAQWRTAMFAFRGALYTTGSLCAYVTCWVLDPSLKDLDWRLCISLTVPPIFCFLIPTVFWLQESPMYLSCMGEHSKAQRIFEQMRELNGCPEVSVSYLCHVDSMTRDASTTGSLWECLQVIFGLGMLGCTAALMFASVSASVFSAGHGYGLPRVLIEEADKHKIHAGAQMFIDGAWGYIACLMLFALDRFLTRKRMLLSFSALLTFGFSAFAWSSVSYWHFWPVAMVLQMSLALLRMVLKMNMMMIALTSTECYPTALISTALGMITGTGRMGSILAPMVFEWFHATTGLSTAFYYACSGIALLNLLSLSKFLPASLESARDISARELKGITTEKATQKAEAHPR